MLSKLHVPIGWKAVSRRTVAEVIEDNCLGMAAQLAFYFFLALFPALLFMVALISFLPVQDLMDGILATLGQFAPQDVLVIVRDQLQEIARGEHGGLLTVAVLGTIWSTSAAMNAIIDTINRAYDIADSRPIWKTRGLAIVLTIALSVFVIVAFSLVLVGPTLATRISATVGLGPVFEWTWKILQWPVVFGLVSTAIGIVYYFAPDAEQEWRWITPGSLLATVLWLVTSLGFKLYVSSFGAYNETYGTLGGMIVLMMWFYLSGLAILVGAELNSVLEHASPEGKKPGERHPGELTAAPALAAPGTPAPGAVLLDRNCYLERANGGTGLAGRPRKTRPSELLVGALALGPLAYWVGRRLKTYSQLTTHNS